MTNSDLARNLETWRSLATSVLRKADDDAPDDLDRSLGTTTDDGIRVAPLHTVADAGFSRELPGEAPFTRGCAATPAALAGTIQNDILKEFMVRNTYIYPPGPSMQIVSDVIAYTSARMPRFNSVSTLHLTEIESAGGMARAVEQGIPKARIDEAAARTQARIDVGRQLIVGVNTLRPDHDEPVAVLKVDNSAVRATQIAGLGRLRAERDGAVCGAALAALTAAAASSTAAAGSLLSLAVEAARRGATVGEISWALERVFGRHTGEVSTVVGIYQAEAGEHPAVSAVRAAVASFAEREGRQPRILVAKMGQDGHSRGQKVVASAFADFGFDVDVGPLFRTPAEVAMQAAESDVHVVRVSSLAGGRRGDLRPGDRPLGRRSHPAVPDDTRTCRSGGTVNAGAHVAAVRGRARTGIGRGLTLVESTRGEDGSLLTARPPGGGAGRGPFLGAHRRQRARRPYANDSPDRGPGGVRPGRPFRRDSRRCGRPHGRGDGRTCGGRSGPPSSPTSRRTRPLSRRLKTLRPPYAPARSLAVEGAERILRSLRRGAASAPTAHEGSRTMNDMPVPQLRGPGLVAIDHVGIAVADLDAALELYEGVFGMRRVHEETNLDQGVREVMLAVGSDPRSGLLQLLAPLTAESPIATFLDRRGPGIQQIAYTVTDVDAAADVLRGHGLRLLFASARPGTAGSRINFVHPKDAGGVLVELVEPASGPR